MSDTAKSTRKIKKRTLAISAAAEEIPVKPNRPATMATTKNIKAYLSMENLPLILSGGGQPVSPHRMADNLHPWG
jgi:hypothetical protein